MSIHTLRKLFASVSATVLLMTTVIVPGMAPVAHAGLEDVDDANMPFAEFTVLDLGTEAADYNAGALTRYELVEMLWESDGAPTDAGPSGLTDVDSAYEAAVNHAVDFEYVSGYTDGTFRGDNIVSREQVSKVTAKFLGYDPLTQAEADAIGADIADWDTVDSNPGGENGLDRYLALMIDLGVFKLNAFGDGTVRPKDPITGTHFASIYTKSNIDPEDNIKLRDGGATAQMYVDVANGGDVDTVLAGGTTTTPDPTPTPDPDPAPTGGTLQVMISPNTAASQAVPVSAGYVNVGTWDIKGAPGTMINRVTWTRGGLLGNSAFNGLYPFVGNDRVADAKNLNNDTNAVEMRIGREIPASGTLSLTLVAEMAAFTTTGPFNFAITDVKSSADTITGLGAASNTHSGVLASVGTTTITASGSPDDLTTGEKGVVSQFEVRADGADGDLLMLAVEFSESEIEDFELIDSNDNVIARVASLNSERLAVFANEDGTPLINFGDGDSQVFKVVALMLADAGSTSAAGIDSNIDVVMVDKDLSGGGVLQMMSVTRTYTRSGCTTTNLVCTLINVDGGKFTIAYSGEPSGGQIPVDTDDVPAMGVNITVEATYATVKDFSLTATATSGVLWGAIAGTNTAYYENFRVRALNSDGSLGATLWGPLDLITAGGANSTTTQTDLFTEDVELPRGTNKMMITFDIVNGAPTGQRIQLTVNGNAMTIEDPNNDSITAVPNAVQSAVLETETAQTTVTLSQTVQSDNQVIGSLLVPVLAIQLRNTGEAGRLNQLNLVCSVDANGDLTYTAGVEGGFSCDSLTNGFVPYIGNTAVSASDTPNSTTGAMTFDDFKLDATTPVNLNVDETVTLVILANVANLAANNGVDFAVEVTGATVTSLRDGGTITVSGLNATVGDGIGLNDGSTGVAPGVNFNILSTGTLTLAMPSDSANARPISFNASGVEVSTVRARATEEDFIGEEMVVVVENATSLRSISGITVTYPKNRDGSETETKGCNSDSTGIYTCTGLNVYVKEDQSAGRKFTDIDITATFTGSPNARTGDRVRFKVGFNNDNNTRFVGKASSGVLTENTIGVPELTTPAANASLVAGVTINNAGTAYTATTTTLVVAASTGIQRGDVICFAANCAATTLEKAYVLATSATSLTVVRNVHNATGATTTDSVTGVANGAQIYLVKATGTVFNEAGNHQVREGVISAFEVVHKTQTTSINGEQEVMRLKLTQDPAGTDMSMEKGSFYGHEAGGTAPTSNGTFNNAATATATTRFSGSLMGVWSDFDAAGDFVMVPTSNLDNLTDLSQYARVNFWIAQDVEGTAGAVVPSRFSVATNNAANVTGATQSVVITGDTNVPSDFVLGQWVNVDLALASVQADTFFGLTVGAGTNAAAGDAVTIDDWVFYDHGITMTIATNNDLRALTPGLYTVKRNGTPTLRGYVDYGNATTSRAGRIIAISYGANPAVELSGVTELVVLGDTTSVNDGNSGTAEITIACGTVNAAGGIAISDKSEGSGGATYTGHCPDSQTNFRTLSLY